MDQYYKAAVLGIFLLISIILFATLDNPLISFSLLSGTMTVAIILQAIQQKQPTDLDHLIQQFRELIAFKRNLVEIDTAKPSHYYRQLADVIKTYEHSIQADTKVAGEMVLVADRVRQGDFSVLVQSDSETPHVHVLRETMNAMLTTSSKNLEEAIELLQALGSGAFKSRIEVTARGILGDMLHNINGLGESLQQMDADNQAAKEQIAQQSKDLADTIETMRNTTMVDFSEMIATSVERISNAAHNENHLTETLHELV